MEPTSTSTAILLNALFNLLKAGAKAATDGELNLDDVGALFAVGDFKAGLEKVLNKKIEPDATVCFTSTMHTLVTTAFVNAYGSYMPFEREGFWKTRAIPRPLQQHFKEAGPKLDEVVDLATVNASDLSDLEQWLYSPTATPTYKALWDFFSLKRRESEDIASEDDETTSTALTVGSSELVATTKEEPLETYLIDPDEDGEKGKGVRAFERIFMVEFTKLWANSELEELKDTMVVLKRELYKGAVTKRGQRSQRRMNPRPEKVSTTTPAVAA